MLHNLALTFNDILEEEQEVEHDEIDVPNQPHWQPGEGFVTRAALIERLFR